MNFTLIKSLKSCQEKQIISFFLKSKPYSFCSLPSHSLCVFKIKEYLNFLLENCEVYIGKNFFVAISIETDIAIVEFVYGSPFNVIRDFEKFRKWFKSKNNQVTHFYTEIQRKHKRKSFLKFIENRDKNAEIKLDNEKICVLWNT
jgi:hypothetical protein